MLGPPNLLTNSLDRSSLIIDVTKLYVIKLKMGFSITSLIGITKTDVASVDLKLGISTLLTISHLSNSKPSSNVALITTLLPDTFLPPPVA